LKVLIFDKTQGLNNVDKPVELPYDKDVGLTYLSKSVNVNVDNKGKIQRRKGASRVLSGNFHSLFAILDYFICVEKVASPPNATGNALTILDTLYNKTVLGYLTGSGRMSYQKVGNRVYFANGTNRGIIENRIYSPWNKQDHVGPVTDKVFSNPPKGHLICLHHGRMFMAENNFTATIKLLGIPDKFIEHGTPDDLYRECGIDAKGITNTVLELLGKTESNMHQSLHSQVKI